MARYAKDHHATSHATILEAASRQLRGKGYDGLSIAEVMKAVGLTHGGFYAHFKSRDELVKKAMDVAFAESEARFRHLISVAQSRNNNGLIAEYYLSDERVGTVATGCPAVALMADRQRMPKALQKCFDDGMEKTRLLLSAQFATKAHANAVMAMLFGTLHMMRATPDQVARAELRKEAVSYLQAL